MKSPLHRDMEIAFTLDAPTTWPCPSCQSGVLAVKRDCFHNNEMYEPGSHRDIATSSFCFDYTFSCMFACTNPHCKETVSCAGVGTIDEARVTDENDMPFRLFYTPKYFVPHLRLIEIPEGCPKSVSALLNESFKLFFCSPSAASNNVRMALEELLTELKVRRFDLVNEQRRFISLHTQITLIPPQYAQLKERILAIKWLGRAESPTNDPVTMYDVIDSYEMFEHILEQIYVPKTKNLGT